jgi:Short C-terminal domain
MFGKKDLEPGEAVIVEKHVKHAGDDGRNTLFEWVADVTPETGEPFRTVLQLPNLALDFLEPDAGDRVTVLIDHKKGTARFDKSDPRLSLKAAKAAKDERFAATAAGAVGSAAPSIPTTSAPGVPGVEFSGAQLMSATDAAPFLQAFLSGDPGARDQAISDLRAHQHPGSPVVADRLSQLEALRAAGTLTDAEYQAQRQRILDTI